jgi:hypothetical protein
MTSGDEQPVFSMDALPDAAAVAITHELAGMPVLRHAGRKISKGRSGRLNIVAAVRDVCALAQTAKRYRRLASEADECAPTNTDVQPTTDISCIATSAHNTAALTTRHPSAQRVHRLLRVHVGFRLMDGSTARRALQQRVYASVRP